eukprot:GEZU01015894.1.p1 GENE.GEZU01015894.1~~GEZU01015894.1.p1  ORF type:complete len:167 (-),score=12.88 GEZU01015894.1:258-758(-)
MSVNKFSLMLVLSMVVLMLLGVFPNKIQEIDLGAVGRIQSSEHRCDLPAVVGAMVEDVVEDLASVHSELDALGVFVAKVRIEEVDVFVNVLIVPAAFFLDIIEEELALVEDLLLQLGAICDDVFPLGGGFGPIGIYVWNFGLWLSCESRVPQLVGKKLDSILVGNA